VLIIGRLSVHFRLEESTHSLRSLEDIIWETCKSCYVHSKTLGTRTVAQCVQESDIILFFGVSFVVIFFDNAFHVT